MTKARYGRMRVGKCVRGDYGYIGCAADVLGKLFLVLIFYEKVTLPCNNLMSP